MVKDLLSEAIIERFVRNGGSISICHGQVGEAFLRLSLVSCPIYLSPATTRTKSIRLHQVWQPALAEEPEDRVPDRGRKEDTSGTLREPALHNNSDAEPDQSGATAMRITLRPHDVKSQLF
jgi:hypothetical protein